MKIVYNENHVDFPVASVPVTKPIIERCAAEDDFSKNFLQQQQ
jgi:hypothetical protein